MSVILILILVSLAVALTFLWAFVWAVRSGQYEDTHTPSMRILMDEDSAAPRPLRIVTDPSDSPK
jgi:cbb3-type cytochrome oxidase maturation protein